MKEYKLFKTAKKTAKENSLMFADNQRIFDFSLLDTLEVPAEEKQEMQATALKTVTANFNTAYCIKSFDNFHFIDGYIDYSIYRVYDSHGKRLYCIFEAENIHHTSGHRKSVWDDYERKSISNGGYAMSRDINFDSYIA